MKHPNKRTKNVKRRFEESPGGAVDFPSTLNGFTTLHPGTKDSQS
jgi:hypothetical protein